MQHTVPYSKAELTQVILEALRLHFHDPVVEINEIQDNHLRIRVRQSGGPRYYNVKISQEV